MRRAARVLVLALLAPEDPPATRPDETTKPQETTSSRTKVGDKKADDTTQNDFSKKTADNHKEPDTDKKDADSGKAAA